MRDYIELGSAPIEEDCIQVSSSKPYFEEMRDECRRYKELLNKVCPIPKSTKAYYSIKFFSHDFGGYLEVCIFFDDEDEEACNFAYKLENELPLRWEA